jgi:hypothetical protein
MRTKLTLGLAAVFISIAVPAGAYWWSTPTDNQFNETLRGFGYRPLPLPTSEMTVGALYSIDSRARYFDVVCDVDAAELTGAVKRTTSPEIEAYMQTDRQFESNIKVDLGWLASGNGKMSEKQTVHFSLTDIAVESISHEKSVDLFISMAERRSCGRAIAEALSGGSYVCQGLKVLEATAEYKLDQDTLGKIDAKASKSDVNSIVKLAVETQSGTEVVERQGKVQSGKKLKYAVAMKPTCMAPPTGRFHRILPDSAFGRWSNYVLFNLIEPLWPNKDEPTRSAEAPVKFAAVE